MKYLDTVIESKERLDKARNNLNIGIILLFIGFTITGFAGIGLYLVGYIVSGLYLMILSAMYLMLIVSFIIKREIYSLAILIKEEK